MVQLYLRQTALVIIDVQNCWYHKEGEMFLPQAHNQLPVIGRLANCFKENGGQVVYTQVVWDNDDEVPGPLKRARPLFEQDKAILRRGTFSSQIHSAVAPQQEDPVVEKKYFDAFSTGNLGDVIGPEIRNLAFVGTTINNCVYSTLLGGAQRGYHTIAVRAGISGFPRENHNFWYKQMESNLGTQVLFTDRELTDLLQ